MIQIPLWLLVVMIAALLILGIIAVVSVFAWFGIASEMNKLRSKIMHIDVFERQEPLRRLAPTPKGEQHG